MTLLEVMVAVVILAGVLTTAFAVMRTSQNAFSYGVSLAVCETRARQVVDGVADMLVDTGTGQINPDLTSVTYCSSLEFRRCVGYGAGAVQWGPLHRIEWQQDPADPDDGIDNDSDGLVDEGRVVWTRNIGEANQSASVLAENVAAYLEGETPDGSDENGNGMSDERGFCLRRAGNEVNIYITIQGRDKKFGLLQATVVSSVRLRN